MNRMGMTLIYVLISHPLLAGSEVTITKVLTFPNESKTSLVIYYEGAPELAFYAVDADEDVLSLDFPGVYSKFDFSSLVLAQVDEVRQVPLDPDESNGMSVRFFLKPNTDYKIYQNPGTLTLLFETTPEASAPAAAVTTARVTAPERTVGTVALPSMGPDARTLSGLAGDNRLYQLSVQPSAMGGLVYLGVDNLQDFRYFSLEAPKRFVLDLRGTLFSLSADQLDLNLPLVQKIRARQFQSHPAPITRLVLDLNDEANISVQEVEGGLTIAFAADSQALAQVMAQRPTSEPARLAATTSEPAHANSLASGDRQPESASESHEEEIPVPGDPAVSLSSDIAADDPHFKAEEVLEGETEMLAARMDPPELAPEQASEQAPHQEADRLAETQTETLADLTEEPAAQPEEPVAQAAADSAADRQVVADTADSRATAAEQGPAATTSQNAAPAEDVPASATVSTVDDDTAAGEMEIVQLEPEIIDTVEILDEPKPMPAPEAFIRDADLAEEGNLFAEKEKRDKQPQPFVMASDVDLEMAEFLSEEENDSLYGLMKGTKSTRANIGRVVVTDKAIDDSRRLAEMKPMQDEDSEEMAPAEIFKSDDRYASLGDDEKQYRGFEIAIIDVRDQPVVDLLRFIADQVGINLYVDPEVGDIRATYSFRNMPWDQVLDIILSNAGLDKEFRNGVLRVATTRKFESEEIARKKLRDQRELSVPTETVYKSLNYANAAEVMPLVSEYLSPRGTILMDERTNTLIIADIPQKIVDIRTLINRLDKMISQVTIEARIVETTTRFLRELGIQWGLTAQYTPEMGTDTGLRFPNRVNVGGPAVDRPRTVNSPVGGYAINFPIVAENPSGFGLTLGNFLDNFKLDISLQLLEQEGQGQIISSPKITTQNNRTALIRNGQRIPIQTIQRGTVTTKFVDAVLELQVTPHITADETIIMDLVVDKSEPDFTRAAGAGGNPIINVSRAETQVLVKNGGTAVIGGIFALNEQNTQNGIPKLRKIPILKRLFGSERKQYTNQELLIFVTPRIVKY